MNTIALTKPHRPSDLILWLVRARWMSALAVALYLVLAQFDASKECRGGAFSAGFSGGFDVRRCDLVLKRFGGGLVRIRLPQS
jgi:hypothetical protein